MISRVADGLFWLGRYLERAESSARVCLVTRNLALDGDLTPRQAWLPAIVVSGEEASFVKRHGDAALEDGEAVQRWLAWEPSNFSSIQSSVAAARENARAVRDAITLETWEAVNELHLWMDGQGREAWDEDRHGFYRHVRQSTQLCLGVIHATMLHDDAFDFVFLGVMLERAGQTARILDVHHHALSLRAASGGDSDSLWLALLRACSGYEPFMKRYQGRVTPTEVARFVVLDARFPRSVLHCLNGAGRFLARVRSGDRKGRPGGLSRLRVLESWVADTTVAHVEAGRLHELLTRVVDETHGICDEIGRELLGAPAPLADERAGQ